MSKHFDIKNDDDKLILDKHLTRYLDAIGKTMLITEAVVLFSTIVIAYLVLKGYFPYKINTRFNVPIHVYFKEQFLHKIIAWTFLCIYFIFNQKMSLTNRKIFLCATILIITALIVFGSWNLNYFGFLFIIPVVIASPFNKRTSRMMLLFALLCELAYTKMQVWLTKNNYNYIQGLVIITVIIVFYFISKSIHKAMFNALYDVKKISLVSKSLEEEVSHDSLTKCYSLSQLNKDLESDEEYNSIAFIDIDNFKNINDVYSHKIGDDILKLLVNSVKLYEEGIYRYGGDEFVILSKISKKELHNVIKRVVTEFKDACYDYLDIKGTLSIGIMSIESNTDKRDCLKQCDELMYVSKHNGKNKITCEK